MVDLQLLRKGIDVNVRIISIDLEDRGFILSIVSTEELVKYLAIFDILGIAALDIDEPVFELDGLLVSMHVHLG